MLNMKTQNENDLFKIEFYDGDIKNELPISLFEEIEAELCDRLLHSSSPEENDETDGTIEFIKNIVDRVKEDFEGLIEDENQKKKFKYSHKGLYYFAKSKSRLYRQ